MRDRIRFLEEELQDRKDESRRKDTIIAQMNQTIAQLTQRVPELEAASEQEPVVSDQEDTARGAVPPDSVEGKINQSWWRRFFGV